VAAYALDVIRRTVLQAALLALAPVLLACGRQPAPVVSAVSRSLEFIENDWPRALAEAKSRKVPLFVEAWAPW
jgi:hypothetical protein